MSIKNEIKNDQVLNHLNKSLKILSSPKRWTKGAYQQTLPDGPRYCVLGSLGYRDVPNGHQGHKDRISKLKAALYLANALPNVYKTGTDPRNLVNITGYNDADSTTHSKILSLIKKAISLRKKDIKSKKETVVPFRSFWS